MAKKENQCNNSLANHQRGEYEMNKCEICGHGPAWVWTTSTCFDKGKYLCYRHGTIYSACEFNKHIFQTATALALLIIAIFVFALIIS